ncbi:MAG: HAMP domain-containing histidine kinase [Planctomycetes bacterium]|nr:HAMP domain-containing histidine kinase [Planctomycetota bacterium]
MTIAKRIVASSTALGAGLLIGGAGVVIVFLDLQRLVTSTHEEFHELCELHQISAHVTSAERSLARQAPKVAEAELQAAQEQLSRFFQFQHDKPSAFDPEHARFEEDAASRIFAAVSTARERVESEPAARAPDTEAIGALEQAGNALSALIGRTEQAIADVHDQSATRFVRTLWILTAVGAVALAAGVAIGVILYRNVVTPLRHLRDGTDRLAAGQLDARLDARGDREFVDLQNAFNRMAAELESLCKTLERRVAEKSRELAIAERLASVGYLAAGVAHEINNPLAIMSGYAESLLRSERSGRPPREATEWVRDLETIRDEAFRCKRITQSLLDLSRLGDDHREPVALEGVVDDCVRLVGAWPASRGVSLKFQQSSGVGSRVYASEPELKQVVLNLLANAIEATAPTRGNVTVGLERSNGWVEVAVRDDGKGMTPETLARAFEPFYSAGKDGTGLGLGLSISHAIARRHGGSLEARSRGPNRGTDVLLRLPELEEHAA